MAVYSAAALAELLGLAPHPEGDYVREVFRSTERERPSRAELRQRLPRLAAIVDALTHG